MNRHDLALGAGAGLLSAAAGLAAGHLVAALIGPAASPVLAVGSAVIDRTPTPLKQWAVETLGNADKPVLLGSVLAGTLLLAALGGVVARRTFPVGAGVVLVLVAVAGWAALSRAAARPVDVIPAIVTAAVALGALRWLSPDATGPREVVDGMGRRRLLMRAGVIAGGALVAGTAGQWLVARVQDVKNIALPRARRPLGPLPRGLESRYRGVTRFQTPNEDFYRVDVNLTVPIVDHDSWTLRIDGMVDRPYELTFAELLDLPMIECDITMCCVSNEVGGPYLGGARWLGVRVSDLLARAGVRPGADQILSTATDGFTISTPLSAAQDGRDMIVAVGMNGEALPREHGFPARLVTPGLYGYVGSTKWLTRMTVTTYRDRSAYWTDRDWATDGPIKIASRIDTPAALKSVDAGRIVVAGVAWAPGRGIAAVEVRVDDGPWQEAQFGPDAGVDYWRQWYLLWDADSGRHTLTVRARTPDGEVQTDDREPPFPDGSSGLQQIVVIVR
ncbi:molybdopterin-dependent oxidoreductase [Aeromicrobium duanguangcaii]|uniref:Molybdopterin-dependent oxidoreductase n=1 Tax=Aeromicrobium duanguangcaii TaxID=2968086 RepID=A0ABY5K9P3_9ACTN|nr:molybdopterin-dependent oxidoreductase [Aeromicrobium duanguangcaii]MCD9152848.1 molybdopterin-dependent oxidoreductase [Aeromicrobium duanguangcaii]UUI67172.1 molybdopterin-dependent oxidoreductase [Aeromicrobium duanguangcaii]